MRTVLVAVALMMAGTTSTLAQETQQTAPQTYSDAQVASFARVALQIQQIQRQAQEQMGSAIDAAEGITRDEYNRMGKALQTDTDLRGRVIAEMQEISGAAAE